MAQLAQFAPPVMARGARFHADQTGLKSVEERLHLTATKGLADNYLAQLINAMDLKNVFRQINADGGNTHSGWLLLLVVPDENHTLALRCREREPSTPSAFSHK